MTASGSVEVLNLPASILDAMKDWAQNAFPEEACGLLGGKDRQVVLHLPVENAEHSRVHFRMEPRQQLESLQRLDAEKLDLVAIWHSHPMGPDEPSASDVAEFFYPGVRVIILSMQGETWQARAFSIEMGQVDALPIKIYPF
ncbi:MAG: M67 family metallopeptidase [Anaerolineaceae bacterium]